MEAFWTMTKGVIPFCIIVHVEGMKGDEIQDYTTGEMKSTVVVT